MKKVFVSMMMAAAVLVGSVAYAQTDATTGATKKAQTENQACCNTPQKGAPGLKGKKKDAKKAYNPFNGIQLTADQQQRLQVLQQGLGPVQLTPEMQAKVKENPNLTPEQKKQLKAERKAKKMEGKKKYLNGVKEVLTPDQYVVFLENVYLYGPDPQVKGAWKHSKKDGKDKDKKKDKGKRGKKGPQQTPKS